jgi:hypothetical protein
VVKQLPVGVGHHILPGRSGSSLTADRPCSKPPLPFTPAHLDTPDNRYTRRRTSSATPRPARVASSRTAERGSSSASRRVAALRGST